MAPAANDDSIPITDLLAEAGFDTPKARVRARAVLEEAALTRPGKQGIARYKREAALAQFKRRLIAVCGRECEALYSGPRETVIATGKCEVCGGSNNRRAALAAAAVLARAGVRRALIVGGTAQQQHELAGLLGSPALHLAFVDGTARSHTQKDAIANMNRVQLVVVWGPTPLRHAISDLYTTEPPPHLRVLQIPRRGIEALCQEVVRSYGR